MNSLSSKDLSLLAILNSIQSGNLFGFTARKTAWDDEETPPSPSTITKTDIASSVLFSKRVSSSDIRILIDRNNWTPATIYTVGTIVLTNENHLYVCTGAGTSVSSPTWISGEDTELTGTVKWTFLETVLPEDLMIYSDADYLPLSWASEAYFWGSLPKKIRVSFQVVSDENGFFPLATPYRTAGLWSNPYDRQPRNNLDGSTNFGDFGSPIGIDTFVAITRVSEQVDRFTFDISLE